MCYLLKNALYVMILLFYCNEAHRTSRNKTQIQKSDSRSSKILGYRHHEMIVPTMGRRMEANLDFLPSTESFTTKRGNQQQAAQRFTTGTKVTKIRKRTPPVRSTFEEQCDYIAAYCSKTYQTGRLCGRSVYYMYATFKNYCMLDFVNCKERYEMWQVLHMGQCYNLKYITEYIQNYKIYDDYFLDDIYVADDQKFELYK